MNDALKKEIISVLTQASIAIDKNNVVKLRMLSNSTINSGSILQDEDVITIAVLMYSLSKVFERVDYKGYKSWGIFYKNTIDDLKKAREELIKNNLNNYRKAIQALLKSVNKLDSKLKIYIKEVIDKAEVTRGSRFYEHGLSIGRIANMLGISRWDLMDYTGKTGIADVKESITGDVKERIKFARSLFK